MGFTLKRSGRKGSITGIPTFEMATEMQEKLGGRIYRDDYKPEDRRGSRELASRLAEFPSFATRVRNKI